MSDDLNIEALINARRELQQYIIGPSFVLKDKKEVKMSDDQCDTTDEIAQPMDVNISKVSNGFIVNIGCKTLVAKIWKEVADGLELYWNDPKKAEEIYCK